MAKCGGKKKSGKRKGGREGERMVIEREDGCVRPIIFFYLDMMARYLSDI